MKKKRLVIAVVILAVVALIAGMLINGITFGIRGKFYFATKYQSTPEDAFWKEYTPDAFSQISNTQNLETFYFDENNALWFAKTDDGSVLIAEMHCKNGKFVYTGGLAITDLSGIVGEPEYSSTVPLYGQNGISSGTGEYFVTMHKLKDDVPSGYTVYDLSSPELANFSIAYRLK